MEFTFDKDYYGEGFNVFPKTKIELEPNETYCFIGCNGIGKSSLIHAIKEKLRRELKAYQIKTDNAYAGLGAIFEPKHVKEERMKSGYAWFEFNDNTSTSFSGNDLYINQMAEAYSSKGEGIVRRFGQSLAVLGTWIRSNNNKTLFIFFDDCDAGTSIDNISEIKDIFEIIINDCKKNNITYYLILTSNSYEMSRNVRCISMADFKEKSFKSYEAYKNFVLRTRAYKNKRFPEEAKE